MVVGYGDNVKLILVRINVGGNTKGLHNLG